MTRTFTDVLLVPAQEWQVPDEELEAHPPAVGPLDHQAKSRDLGGGVLLEFIGDAERVMDACEPRGENFAPARQYGQRYTFVRPKAPEPAGRWDADGALMACVALSRLIRANAAGTRYAARIEEQPGAPRAIAPARSGFRAWVARPDQRLWLDADDAEALGTLHDRWRSDREVLGERVRHALWLCEYGFRIPFLEVALPHHVTALEALLNTDEGGAGRQFRERVPQLAAAVEVEGVDEELCRHVWRERSRATHGEQVSLSEHPVGADVLDLLQQVLRFALRRCIEDESFRRCFAEPSAVRTRFPLR